MNGKISILIVDDDPDSLFLLAHIFEAAGYHVYSCDNGESALVTVVEHLPNLILLDIQMKGMDGFEVCRQLKANETTKDIPVIFISASTDVKEKVNGLRLGAVDYISKPFHAEELRVRVKTHLTISQSIHENRENLKQSQIASEDRYQSILKTAMDGFWMVDLDGKLLEVNETYCRMSGYSREELMTMCIADLEVTETNSEVTNHIQKIMANGQDRFESCHHRKDGSVYDVETSVQYRPQENKIVAFIRDITERKQEEIERSRLESQLQQAQKMESVGRLAGGVAHDFNNMLQVILGNAFLAMGEVPPDSSTYESLREIEECANRSSDLTRQLLAFARKQTINPEVLDINDTLSGMLKMLKRIIGEDIDLEWIPGPDIWQVKMDPSQIDQIFANLCVNSRDAIDGVGKMTIETGNHIFDEEYCAEHAGFIPGEYVRLAVSDDGCGMNNDILSHLFEPFFTTKDIGKGTGLGLATVYGIVKQNNGFINVYSELGQGTTFTIYLPRHAGELTQKHNNHEKEPLLLGQETILLVEDELTILKMTTTLLNRLGYSVMTASNPFEAIQLAKDHAGEIHLVITDVVMPDMNGRNLVRQLHTLYPLMKAMFMSGYTANVIAHHGVLDEGVYFLQKPFSMNELAEKVREALE